MQKDKRRKCGVCRGRFDDDQIVQWLKDHKNFGLIPFICPDCFEWFRNMELDIPDADSTVYRILDEYERKSGLSFDKKVD